MVSISRGHSRTYRRQEEKGGREDQDEVHQLGTDHGLTPIISVPSMLRKDVHKFQASLSYIMSSRPALAIIRPYLKTTTATKITITNHKMEKNEPMGRLPIQCPPIHLTLIADSRECRATRVSTARMSRTTEGPGQVTSSTYRSRGSRLVARSP